MDRSCTVSAVILRKRNDMELEIRKGSQADTEQLILLLQEVYRDMEQKEWLYLDEPDEVRQMMRDGTMELWVAMDGDRMAAAFDILHPGLEPYNYGYDLELNACELLRVINMDTIAVDPAYRGMGLQKRLVSEAEQEIVRHGSRILLCTVHPDNRYSLGNFLELGYTIERKLQKYGSVRYLLRKNVP